MKAHTLLLWLCSALLVLQCNSSNNGGKSSNLPLPDIPGSPGAGLQSEVQLDGRFVRGLRIEQGNRSGMGAQQEVELQFTALGMSGIGQFEIKIAPDPLAAFDLSALNFSPDMPFITVPPGVEVQEDNQLWIIGANVQRNSNGDATLGTLTLRTSSTFNLATLRVVFFSMGPSSSERENYTDELLNMGVVLSD